MSVVYTLDQQMSILFYHNMATFPGIPYHSETPITRPAELKQTQGTIVGQV